jgi:ABC-type transport system involved in multi-copper enzyme maturation permease subunit
MRLLAAELRKLRRPLAVWTVLAVVVLMGLFAWGSSKQASDQLRFAGIIAPGAPTCAQLGLQPGPACDQRRELIRKNGARAAAQQLADVRASAQVLSPLGAGRMAAGMMASLMGAVVLLLLAGGHVGQEWSGRTLKQILVQEGRRWRILAAKLASLWIAGMALIALAWLALAALLPILEAAYPLHVHVDAGPALSISLHEVARASLVIAVFAALGLLTAAITRNTLGAFFLGFAFVMGSMILGGFPRVARFTLAYWVAGWMRFGPGIASVQTHIWRDDFYPLRLPHASVGLAGLVVFGVLCAGLAWLRFERSDVKV